MDMKRNLGIIFIYRKPRGLFFRTANGWLGFATRITVGTKNLRPIS